MQKNNRNSLRAITSGAMMAALSIILERILALMPASNTMDIRISLSNVPIILAGILISPIIGGIAGVVSDVVGCLISGYPPFPILTFAPFVTGFLPGMIMRFYNHGVKYSFVKVALAIAVSHVFSSMLITTYGLCVMRGVNFVPMLITRLPSMGANLVIDITLVYLLLKTPITKIR